MTQCSRRFAPRTPAARRAFTLLELLVAATITALLAGFLAVVVGDVAGFWSRTSGRLTTEAQARIVLDQLSLDLQSAHFEDDGNTWLAATVQNTTGGIPNWISNDQNPARAKPATALSLNMIAADFSSDANRFGVAGTWLRFYTTARGTNQNTGAAPFAVNASAPVAVSYQIVRRIASTATTTAAARRYLLHRAQVRPALNGTALGTLEAGRNITATAYARTTPAAGNTGANGDPRTVRAPTLDSVIADNVIDFGVRFYVRDAATVGGLRLVFPANTAGVPANTPLTYLANVPPGGS
ncbi:MAG: prepilin-type N-terminal cleavage/methylation domain-containing protein, partial [Verrucomicrobia bacterium]|nr:prepilin-type N-terminal cleavage/methylation domain-containing protein [Verrucomicrobiota bacterium]